MPEKGGVLTPDHGSEIYLVNNTLIIISESIFDFCLILFFSKNIKFAKFIRNFTLVFILLLQSIDMLLYICKLIELLVP